jgi:DNA-binding transcriptional ArsR family regulator
MGQSKVFSHMRKLKDAGLVLEEKRGNSSFYSLDREAVQGLLGESTEHLLAERPWPPVYDSFAGLSLKRRYEVVTAGYEDLR